jgi:hypothetical protein
MRGPARHADAERLSAPHTSHRHMPVHDANSDASLATAAAAEAEAEAGTGRLRTFAEQLAAALAPKPCFFIPATERVHDLRGAALRLATTFQVWGAG